MRSHRCANFRQKKAKFCIIEHRFWDNRCPNISCQVVQLFSFVVCFFPFCRDPLHVIFQVTWTNESKVAVVTWSAGNIRAISKHIVVKSKQMQWVRICICSGKQFEDAIENQTNCTRVAMHIEGNLKKHLRRTVEEVKQMQYVWLCIISIEPFTESFDKTYRRQAKRMQPV